MFAELLRVAEPGYAFVALVFLRELCQTRSPGTAARTACDAGLALSAPLAAILIAALIPGLRAVVLEAAESALTFLAIGAGVFGLIDILLGSGLGKAALAVRLLALLGWCGMLPTWFSSSVTGAASATVLSIGAVYLGAFGVVRLLCAANEQALAKCLSGQPLLAKLLLGDAEWASRITAESVRSRGPCHARSRQIACRSGRR